MFISREYCMMFEKSDMLWISGKQVNMNFQ